MQKEYLNDIFRSMVGITESPLGTIAKFTTLESIIDGGWMSRETKVELIDELNRTKNAEDQYEYLNKYSSISGSNIRNIFLAYAQLCQDHPNDLVDIRIDINDPDSYSGIILVHQGKVYGYSDSWTKLFDIRNYISICSYRDILNYLDRVTHREYLVQHSDLKDITNDILINIVNMNLKPRRIYSYIGPNEQNAKVVTGLIEDMLKPGSNILRLQNTIQKYSNGSNLPVIVDNQVTEIYEFAIRQRITDDIMYLKLRKIIRYIITQCPPLGCKPTRNIPRILISYRDISVI